MMSKRDIKYMDELEAINKMRPAMPIVIMLFTIMVFVVFLIVWAAVAQVDIITRAQGQVIPSQEIQLVQSLEGGILQEMLVEKGDKVKKGQILLRISDVTASSEERGTKARLMSLLAKEARLRAESSGEKFVMPEAIKSEIQQIAANEESLYKSRQDELGAAHSLYDERVNKVRADLSELKAEVKRLYKSRSMLNKELSITKEMVEKRAVPKLDQIRLERELADISGQIEARAEEKIGLEAQLSGTENERDAQDSKFRSMAFEELNETQTHISALKENLTSVGDRVDRTEIRSPVDGVVNQIKIKTIGGIVEPAMKLVEIVPYGEDLKIIARVKPDEVAFLKEGQPVKVKITAYDPQRYGSLDGKLSRVSANSVSDQQGDVMFEVEVHTDKNYLGTVLNPLPVTAGMVANVDIITGKRTILNYLTKPFHRGLGRVFRER